MVTCKDIGKRGRLGNQLWQIAAVIATARRFGTGWDITGWAYAKYFPNLPLKKEAPGVNMNISGYFQDARIFKAIEDELRVMFTPQVGMLPDMRGKVGVHFRAYVNEGAEVSRIHPECELGYYVEALKYYSEKARLVVFSDDIPRARKMLPLDGEYMAGNTDIMDLALMAGCGGLIISNSSFAWWAGWMNQGKVIIPRQWYGAGVRRDTVGLYLKNWIAV